MPRFSSLRSLWTVARSGILLSIFVCVVSSNGAAFAQMDSDKTATMELGDPVDPMYSGSPGAQQQTATITNVGSGLKRSENSLAKIQALLYSDTTFVVRIDLNKIDYESVAAFVDEVVDKAGGTVQSNDEYLVSLRESQKANAKSSFKTLLSTLQNIFVQKAFNNKFDEVYLIAYQNDSGDSCQILATPIDGLSAEEQNAAIDAIESIWSPITIFSLPAIWRAAAMQYSWLRPPTPFSCPTVTTFSPEVISTTGARKGSPILSQHRAIWALTFPASAASASMYSDSITHLKPSSAAFSRTAG